MRQQTASSGLKRTVGGAALGLVVVLTLAAAAAAALRNCKPKDPDCSATTTTTMQQTGLEACNPDEGGIITIPGSNRTVFECLWTPEAAETTVGSVSVNPFEGTIRYLAVFVRDDSPGDICLLRNECDGQPPFVASFDLAYGNLPDDETWDPDDLYPDFAPYENQTYWSFGGIHWCYPMDGVDGMREDTNGAPLHLYVALRAEKDTTVQIALFPNQEGASAAIP